MTALGALVQMTIFQLVGLVVTAFRADEVIFPATPVQLFQTCILSKILLAPFKNIGKVPLHLNFPRWQVQSVNNVVL